MLTTARFIGGLLGGPTAALVTTIGIVLPAVVVTSAAPAVASARVLPRLQANSARRAGGIMGPQKRMENGTL